MRTVELAKVIRKALAEDFPELKASVRKTDLLYKVFFKQETLP